MKHLTAAWKFCAEFVTRKEEGDTLASYGLLLVLVAGVCVTAIALLGNKISDMFAAVAGSI